MYLFLHIITDLFSISISYKISFLVKGRNISDVGIIMYENAKISLLTGTILTILLQSCSILLIHQYADKI